jgi:hypothetical protein
MGYLLLYHQRPERTDAAVAVFANRTGSVGVLVQHRGASKDSLEYLSWL